MITFIVTKDDNKKTIEFSNEGTLLDLKKEIIKQFKVDYEYIDIISNVERPIRVLGKFNFDKGLQPRTLDNYPFDRYGIDDRTIPITFNEVLDYLPDLNIKKNNNSGKYVPPNSRDKEEYKSTEFTLDINSNEDFPALC
jgi:hypothetical protein